MVKKFLKDFSGPPVKLKNLKCLKIEQKLHLPYCYLDTPRGL